MSARTRDIRASRAQSDRCAKRESGKDQRQMKLAVEPVERGADIFDFPIALIVFALTQAGSAKVEAQHGKTKTVQRLHGVKDDFVVQRSAKQRMRMADHSGMSGILGAGVEQRFQSSGWTVEKQRTDG